MIRWMAVFQRDMSYKFRKRGEEEKNKIDEKVILLDCFRITFVDEFLHK